MIHRALNHKQVPEERGRCGAGGRIHSNEPHNQAVAEQLADEVACPADSVGGGPMHPGPAGA